MQIEKTILILAKSAKHKGKCIAGKTINDKEWIRPVKMSEPFSDEDLKNVSNLNRTLKPLDIVKMKFKKKSPEKHQPENFLVDLSEKWYFIGKVENNILEYFIDKNDNCLLNSIQINKISSEKINNMVIKSSLQLIKITKSNNCNVYHNEINIDFYKPRLSFNYNNISFDLPITDPKWFPNGAPNKRNFKIENGYCSIGLGEIYEGYHFLLVVMLNKI